MTEYIELHAHSYYSLLDGTASPGDLVAHAADLGLPALALTDHDAVYGAVAFAGAAETHGVHPIFGAELTLATGHHLTLLVENATGWANLCGLITRARLNAPKGAAALPLDYLPGHTDGLIALSGCRQGTVAAALRAGDKGKALTAARDLRSLFGRDRCYIELQHHLLPGDRRLNAALVDLAAHLKLPTVATNNVHYLRRDDHRVQDVLVGIRHNTPLYDCPHLRPNSEFYLKSPGEMAALFAGDPDAVTNTLRIAERCQFRPPVGMQRLPAFPVPDGLSPADTLLDLCQSSRRFDRSERMTAQLAYEVRVIEAAGLANYFLVVWDIVRFANEQGIRCQGRGSAANSLVAYLLHISPVNPLAHDLVFERFLSEERQAVPDIDIDFQADRREEVIQYIYRRYGHDHAAMACTLVTFRSRSIRRDVGKVLGLPNTLLEKLTQDEPSDDPQLLQVYDLCAALDRLPRHLGIHNGGMVITGSPLSETIPVEPATMPDRTVVQWDKYALEDAGMVKIDILGLRMLSLLAEALTTIEEKDGTIIDLDALTCDDPAVYALITAADTVGVFQVESRAQAQVQPRFKPTCFADLVVAISLIRPGPIQGDMTHPYLRRRMGVEPVTYFHPLLEPALKETLGVILFQEQVLKVARDLAGFTAGQGEQLRRALGSKHPEQAAAFEGLFVAGALDRDVPEATARAVFAKLQAFGGYSFPKSHAAAFAVLVYQSAWLKCYHPLPFYTALLNHQPMGFWSPAVVVNDAKRRGLTLQPLDIARSQARCAVEDAALRLGFNYVKGMGDAHAEAIVAARDNAPFTDLADLYRRTRLPKRLLEHLILAGALDIWGARRDLLWTLGALVPLDDGLPLDEALEPVALPPLTAAETLSHEFAMLGVSLDTHPLQLYREGLTARGILHSDDIRRCDEGARVQVAGLVVMHQAPMTAKGYRFLTLEDEFGFSNIVVRPHVYLKFREVIQGASLLVVRGEVQRQGDVVNVVAAELRDITCLT